MMWPFKRKKQPRQLDPQEAQEKIIAAMPGGVFPAILGEKFPLKGYWFELVGFGPDGVSLEFVGPTAKARKGSTHAGKHSSPKHHNAFAKHNAFRTSHDWSNLDAERKPGHGEQAD